MTDGEIRREHNLDKALGIERTCWPAIEMLVSEFKPEIVRGVDMYSYLLQRLDEGEVFLAVDGENLDIEGVGEPGE